MTDDRRRSSSVTLRGLLGRRRMILLSCWPGCRSCIALLVRLGGGRPDADRVLDTLVVRTVMPLVALVVGTAAIGSEIEDGTAVYLLIKPIPRWRIALAKILVAAGLTAVLVVPAVVLTGVLLGRAGTDTVDDDRRASACACLVGGSAYAAAFVALSAVHVPGAPPRARLRADLGGRPRPGSSRGPGSCRSARRRWASRRPSASTRRAIR